MPPPAYAGSARARAAAGWLGCDVRAGRLGAGQRTSIWCPSKASAPPGGVSVEERRREAEKIEAGEGAESRESDAYDAADESEPRSERVESHVRLRRSRVVGRHPHQVGAKGFGSVGETLILSSHFGRQRRQPRL